jgi:hypothetical protein
VVLACALIVLAVAAGLNLFGSVLAVVTTVLIIVVYLGIAFGYGPNRTVRDWPNQKYERTLTLTDAGIHEQTANAARQEDWTYWSTFKTLPRVYLLVTGEQVLALPQTLARDTEMRIRIT